MEIMTLVIAGVFSLISLYIGIKSLTGYLAASKNHVNTFYWGLSFIFMFFGYILSIVYQTIAPADMMRPLANILRMLENFVAWFQLLAVAYSTLWCPRYDTPSCRRCKFCFKKLKWDIPIVLCIVTTVVGQFISDLGFENTSILNGVNIYYAFVHLIVLGVIIYLLLKSTNFESGLAVAYVGIWLNNLLMIVSLVLPKRVETNIQIVGVGLMQVSAALLFYEVLKLFSKERRK